MGIQHQRVDRPGVRQLPEGCGEQEKMERAGCKVVSDTPAISTDYGKSEVKILRANVSPLRVIRVYIRRPYIEQLNVMK